MDETTDITLDVDDDALRLIDRLIEQGIYASRDDAIRAAVRDQLTREPIPAGDAPEHHHQYLFMI